MHYQSSPVGNEISCVMHGIKDEIINDANLLKTALIDGLNKEKFTILGNVDHIFEPKGYSIVVLLSESHATIHTYPEYNSLAFHLYSCRGPEDGNITLAHLKEALNSANIDLGGRKVIVEAGYDYQP